MSTVISRVPQVLDYLVALFAADPTIGTAPVPVAVYDGPALTAATAQLILWVGLDGPDTDSAASAAESTREWSGLGGQSELIMVHCVAEAWSGDDTIATVRTAAYGIVAAVETLVRDPAVNAGGFGANAMLADPGVTSGALMQNATTTGAQARVSFQIVLKAL